RVGIEFGRVGFGQFENVPREFDRGDLHAEAKAEVRNVVFASELGGLDFSLDAALAKTAGDQNPTQSLKMFVGAVAFDFLGVHALDFHAAIVGDAAVNDGFINSLVGVEKSNVFADYANADAVLRRNELADDLLPVRH